MRFYKYLPLIILAIFCFNCEGPIIHKIVGHFEKGNVKNISVLKGSSIIQEIEFSIQGNVLKRSFYEDEHLFGEWTSGDFFQENELVLNYYNNGALKIRGYIINNQLHGKWSYYNRDGELASDRYYFYGKPIADWYSYHHDKIYDIVNYGYIKGDGHWLEYYNNGKIKESTFFNNNKRSGNYQSNYSDGSVKIKGSYNADKKYGQWTYYNKSEKNIKIENYNLGLLHGDIFHYFKVIKFYFQLIPLFSLLLNYVVPLIYSIFHYPYHLF